MLQRSIVVIGVLMSVELVRSNVDGALDPWLVVIYGLAVWPLAAVFLRRPEFRLVGLTGGALTVAFGLLGALAGGLLFLPTGVAALAAAGLPGRTRAHRGPATS